MSEITHLICAHCGGDTALSNAPYSAESSLTIFKQSLIFNCNICGTHYRLPVVVRARESLGRENEVLYVNLTPNTNLVLEATK